MSSATISRSGSLLLSFVVCSAIVCGFVAANERFVHWFVIPIFVCGVIVGVDGIQWLLGRHDLFDPAGIVGIIGLHFFFLAPLLHVHWDYSISASLPAIDPPADWREWLGRMAIWNAAGLILYRIAMNRAALWRGKSSQDSVWLVNKTPLLLSAACGLAISVCAQSWIYAQFGGIGGFIEACTEKSSEATHADAAFAGMGWTLILAECLPILAMISYAATVGRTRVGRSYFTIIVVFLLFFVLRILFGGLHGSRSNTIWALFWAAGILHFWVRPLSKTFVFVGVCFLIVFMYAYGFYKSLGTGALTALSEGEKPSELGERTGRTFEGLLLGDFGRADVQAFLLYRLSLPDRDYSYAWGRTYMSTITLMVPRSFWPNRPPSKLKEGTELQYGVGSFDSEGWASSREYGIAGEAMLNFGPAAIPPAYLLFGLLVGRLRRFLSKLHLDDVRRFLSPFLVILCFWMLVADSNTMLFVIVKDGLAPAMVVWIGSRVIRYSCQAHSERELASGMPAGLTS